MSSSTHRYGKKDKSNRKTTPLSLEKLEDRMMFALGDIEQQLHLLSSSNVGGSPIQLFADSNAAPTVATAARTNVAPTGKATTATLSVLGRDDKGEPNLIYTWRATTVPTGGAVNFGTNGTNDAKQTLATFTKAGTYTITATIKDQGGLTTTSTLNVTVSQTLTSIAVKSGTKVITSDSPLVVEGTSQRLTAVGLDQFGNALETQPLLQWTVPTSTSVDSGNDGATVTFTKAGSFAVKVASGTVSNTVMLNVVQKLTSASGVVNKVAVNSGSTVNFSGTSQNVSVIGYDQFNAKMATTPTWAWSASPSPTITALNETATIDFSKAGSYAVKAQSGAVAFTFTDVVAQSQKSLAVYLPGTSPTLISGPVSIGTTSQRFIVKALDQFGIAMVSQPSTSWSAATVPVGGGATFNTTNEGTTATFTTAGIYGLSVTAGGSTAKINVSVASTVASFALFNASNQQINANATLDSTLLKERFTIRAYDQYGTLLTKSPTITWTATALNRDSLPTFVQSGDTTTMTFDRATTYTVRAQVGTLSQTFTVRVAGVATKFAMATSDGTSLAYNGNVNTSGISTKVSVVAMDQFGFALATQPNLIWTAPSTPTDGTIRTEYAKDGTTITFNKVGKYGLTATAGNVSASFSVVVTGVIKGLSLTPGTANVVTGATQQFVAQAVDQFQNALERQPTVVFTTTGGQINSSGLFTAPSTTGSFTIRATSGTFTATATVTVNAPVPSNGLLNAALNTLVQTLDADGVLNRTEMMQVLRSVGNDGTVDESELLDLRYLVSHASQYNIASYITVLAGNVVNGNTANARYLGNALGNLAIGSSATVLNNLVNKWFMGTDAPAITDSGVTYQNATGSLFVGNPSHLDEHQGMLGDCYYISSLGTIADRNPDAIRNMFLDNGDNTFTVRFYTTNGTADYVTVDRRLAASSNHMLVYSGYGYSVTSTTHPLWIALAEKAYAQWNETGKEGRNGTNTYSGIEGGWMGYVNQQVLGTNSATYGMDANTKATMIAALNSNKAVTIGTRTSAGNGLYGSHAYAVLSYSSSSDTFTLYNPWGVSHPGALSWNQLITNCAAFVVADAAGSTPILGSLRNEVPDAFQSMVIVDKPVSSRVDGDTVANQADVSKLEKDEVDRLSAIATTEESTSETRFKIVVSDSDLVSDVSSLKDIEDRVDAIFGSIDLDEFLRS